MKNKDLKKALASYIYNSTGKAFLSIKEAAGTLGVSADWLSNILKSSNITYHHKEKISINDYVTALVNSYQYEYKEVIKEKEIELDLKIEKPFLTISDIQKLLGCTYQTAKMYLYSKPFFALCDKYGCSNKKFYFFQDVIKCA